MHGGPGAGEPGGRDIDAALRRALDPLRARPRLVATAEIARGSTRWGEAYAIATGHRGGPYLRLPAAAGRLAEDLDGERTVATIAEAHDVEHRDVIDLVGALRAAGVVEGGSVDVYATIGERVSPGWRRLGARAVHHLRHQTLVIPGVDRVAGVLERALGQVLFSLWALAVTSVVVVAGLAAFVAAGEKGTIDPVGALSGSAAAVVVLVVLASVGVHEFGHALAVKRAGRTVTRAGFQLYLGHPAFFVDSTDLLFASRFDRARNAAIGPYVDLVTGGVAGLIAWRCPETGAGVVASRVALLTYVTVLVNLVPFVELDGYWLLIDVLDTPRLRTRSLALLRREVPRRVRGERGPFRGRERLMLAFGLLGLLFTAGALAAAWFLWWPLVVAVARSLWGAGSVGRAGLALLVVVAAGPVMLAATTAGRAGVQLARRAAADARFRLQRRWRVEAAESIARLALDDAPDHDVLSEIAGLVRRRPVVGGETVVALGDGGHDWFVVRRGRVEVLDASGQVLAVLVAGQAFGETALVSRGPRTASVRAVTDGELFVLDAGAYLRLLAPALLPEGAGA